MLNYDKNIKIVNRKKRENSMIVKKKGLYLGLLVSLVGVGNVMLFGQGWKWKATIKNNTPYTVIFKAGLKACGTQKKVLASGDIGEIEGSKNSLCAVNKMEATVHRSGLPTVEASPWSTGGFGIRRGSFVINGSDKTGYRITWTE